MEVSYLRVDGDKIINEACIRWVEKMDDCLYICSKITGCHVKNGDTHKICKINNLDSYNKLAKHFDKKDFD